MPPTDTPTQRDETDRFQKRFLLLAVVGISVLFFWMIESMWMALLLGALAAGLSHPIYQRLLVLLRGHRVVSAIVVIIGLLVLVIAPLVVLIGAVVGQAVEITEQVGPWIESHVGNPTELSRLLADLPIPDWVPEAAIPDRTKVFETVGNAVNTAGSAIVGSLAAVGRGAATFLLQVFVFLYAVFYFLLSGRQTLDRILYLVPLESDDEEHIIERFLSVTRATLRGSIMIGGVQGLLAGLALAVVGVPGPAFWGLIVVVFSVIPGIGAPIVWIPAVIWLFSTGETFNAIALALWCAVVVGSIDNLLRPRWVGSDAKMSDLMILISTLGGISLFGPVGFIIGPIVAAVFVTLWDVYGRAFAESLPALETTHSAAPADGAPPAEFATTASNTHEEKKRGDPGGSDAREE